MSSITLPQPIKQTIHGLHDKVFQNVHRRKLIYNTCWEDPRIDRELLKLDPDSKILMITSAGCNALDYLLDDPAEIHAVDVNPAQNALLALKMAFFKNLSHEQLFNFFGKGAHPEYQQIYQSIRPHLATPYQQYWDQHIHYFKPRAIKGSFYFRGTSGLIAWTVCHFLMRLHPGLFPKMQKMVNATSLEEQNALYEEIAPMFWNALNRTIAGHPFAMTMVGVPRLQINLIRDTYPGGLKNFVQDKIAQVFTKVKMSENYFWRVYLTGKYTRDCCPEYLKAENFDTLRSRVDRIQLHNSLITPLLKNSDRSLSHFVLLDHMDWLASYDNQALIEEWKWIGMRSEKNAKYLLRSAAPNLAFFPERVTESLDFDNRLTHKLHQGDRVGTYGSVHLASQKKQ